MVCLPIFPEIMKIGVITNGETRSVHGAAKKFAIIGEFARIPHVLENPANFQCAEVSGKWQAGFRAEPVDATLLGEFRHRALDASVLPNNRVANRAAVGFLPENDGFALIGNADSGKVFGLEDFLLHGFPNHVLSAPPDFFGVVFNPSRRGINLFMFFLG